MRIAWTQCIAAMLALVLSISCFAAREAAWLDARKKSAEVLMAIADSDADLQSRVVARLTLADRALNQSVDIAREHLGWSETELTPGSDAADFALAVRCQLEHRQGLDEARVTCGRIVDSVVTLDNAFVQAFIHGTLAYYFYREGDHARSLDEAEICLALADAMDDPGLLAVANNIIGLHYATRLRPRMSLPHLEAALANARALPYLEFKMLVQLNLASSYTYLGRAEEALSLLREAQASPVVDLYPTRRLVVQSMVGQARVATGDFERADADLLATMDEVRELVRPDALSFGYTGLAIIHLAADRPDDALNSLDQVLAIVGQTLESGLSHPRVQLIVVHYASALRKSGQVDAARKLLRAVIDTVPADEPDQLLVDAQREMALILMALGDQVGARRASERASQLDALLWNTSFQYQVARLSASLESDRRELELERAQERAVAMRDKAERETTLRRLSWILGATFLALILLFQSRRMQKHMADSERAANARLEGEVQARTRDLESEMAMRMQSEVERRRLSERVSEGEKMRVLGQVTAGVAHDFNNLMTVVTLGVDRLRHTMVSDDTRPVTDVLNHIVEAADTGAKITQGLLAYVRKQPLTPQVHQVGVLLEAAVPIFRNTLGERIAFTCNTRPCHALVDKGQLITSVLNLLLNAKEAIADHGDVALSVAPINDQARIVVRDSGSGMSDESRERAFEPFYTTKSGGEGTGLGLSMVYGFARQSGGDLKIESVPGQGTEVTLTLPLVEPDGGVEKPLPVANRVAPTGTRVLVVEDRGMLLHILEPTLEQMGLDVTTAANADDALSIVARDGMPDLLISDIVMPGVKDGLGLAAELRKRAGELPIILMSGYSSDVDDEATLLKKPFTVAELEAAIEQALTMSSSATLTS